MPFISTSLAALAIASTAISGSGAVGGTVEHPRTSTVSSVAATQATIVELDRFMPGDSAFTGKASSDAREIRIYGVLRPGVSIDGVVAADGTFAVELSPFENRLQPTMKLSIVAVDANGVEGQALEYVVPFPDGPGDPAPGVDVSVDDYAAGSLKVTGTATPDSVIIIRGVPQTPEAPGDPVGHVGLDGKFSVDVTRHASSLVAGTVLTAENFGLYGKPLSTKQFTVAENDGPADPAPDPDPELPSPIQVHSLVEGATAITGTVPAGFTAIAVELNDGTNVFGTINPDNSFRIDVASESRQIVEGFTVSVWALDHDGNTLETTVDIVHA